MLRDRGLLEVVGIIRAGDWKNSVRRREGEWANVSYHAFFRSPQAAVQLFGQARAKNPTLPATAELVQSLWQADLDIHAFQTMAEIAEGPSWWQGEFHLYMAMILEQEGGSQSYGLRVSPSP